MGALRRPLAAVMATALAAGVAVLGAAPAVAAPEGTISNQASSVGGKLTLVFGADGLAPGVTIAPNSVAVTLAGQKVVSKATPLTDATEAPIRRSMLVIDVSGSMRQSTSDGATRIDAARVAAAAYLAAVPADVQVGLITFEDTPVVVVPPTTDRAPVAQAIAALAATNGNTALFDAVSLANKTLGPVGVRNQLVLADGADSTSSTLAAAVASVKASGSIFDAVALSDKPADAASLTAMAKAGNGQVVKTTEATTLTETFRAVAAAQATELLVEVDVPAALTGKSQPITVTATAGSAPVSADTVTPILAAVATPTADPTELYGPQAVAPYSPGFTDRPWVLPVAVLAIGIALFVILAVALLATDRDAQTKGRVRRRLSRYSLSSRTESPSTTTSTALGESAVARSAVELAGRVVQRRDIDTGLGTKLEAAGVPLRPAEWMLIHIGITVGLALVVTLLTGFRPLPTILALAIGFALPYAYLSIKEGRRMARFSEQLPGTLQLLSGSLAAGYSLLQAIDTVVRESDGPMAAELNRAIVEARLGVQVEDALETTARRMNSVDFAWVVMAIRTQRDVGGNLSEVLNNVAATMRERERLRRQVDVLSAEGRLSAIILGALPVLFVTYLVLVRPEYIGLLVTTPLGIIMIVVGLTLMLAGAFWMRKVIKVEV